MMNWSEWEPEEQQRNTISPYWLIAFLIFVAGMVLYAAKVSADSPTLIAKGVNGDWIRLIDEPCPGAPAWFKLRKAEMFYQGKNYAACWRADGGAVLVFDDNGDFSMVPVQAFGREPSA
jgi:hypothetical protein